MEEKKKKKSYKSKGIDLMPFLSIAGIIGVFFAFLIISYSIKSGNHLLSFSIIALTAGLLFESRRLSDNWSTVIGGFLLSFVISFTAFLPGKNEHRYDFDMHVQMWPYVFIFFYTILSMVFYEKKIMPKLTEGITLFQSVAVIYWAIDSDFIYYDEWYYKVPIITGLLFSVYSFTHAFSNIELNKTHRLALSIWSSIIMLLFGIYNIYCVYQNESIEEAYSLLRAFFIGLQYFLLGVSSIYIVQNAFMLLRFLPDRNEFFNKSYFKDIKELKKEHEERYSTQQVNIFYSFLCVVFSATIYYLNYTYQLIPKNMAIWLTFFVFPYFLKLYEFVFKKLKSDTLE